MKNTLEKINIRLGSTKEQTRDFERQVEINQSEQHKGKRIFLKKKKTTKTRV